MPDAFSMQVTSVATDSAEPLTYLRADSEAFTPDLDKCQTVLPRFGEQLESELLRVL